MKQFVTQLVNFRENIHQSFPFLSDATMELINAESRHLSKVVYSLLFDNFCIDHKIIIFQSGTGEAKALLHDLHHFYLYLVKLYL